MADLCLTLKRPDEAVRNAGIAVSLRPERADLLAAPSAAFLSTGDAEKALLHRQECPGQGARSPPNSPPGPWPACSTPAAGPAEALRGAEAALKVSPYFRRTRLSLEGTLRRNLNDCPRVRPPLWQRALGLDPWNADLHYRLAGLLGRRPSATAPARSNTRPTSTSRLEKELRRRRGRLRACSAGHSRAAVRWRPAAGPL